MHVGGLRAKNLEELVGANEVSCYLPGCPVGHGVARECSYAANATIQLLSS